MASLKEKINLISMMWNPIQMFSSVLPQWTVQAFFLNGLVKVAMINLSQLLSIQYINIYV